MKSKSLKVGLLFILIAFAVFPLSSAFARQSVKPIQKLIQKPTPPIHHSAFKMKADLEILGMGNRHWKGECSACSDTLARVGAFYLNDLTVHVVCNSNIVKKTGGTIRVTYYDLVQGKSVSIRKHFSNLSCQLQPRDVIITMVDHPLLIKRSTGIRATVTPDAPVEDHNLRNNRITVRDPSKMCIHSMPY